MKRPFGVSNELRYLNTRPSTSTLENMTTLKNSSRFGELSTASPSIPGKTCSAVNIASLRKELRSLQLHSITGVTTSELSTIGAGSKHNSRPYRIQGADSCAFGAQPLRSSTAFENTLHAAPGMSREQEQIADTPCTRANVRIIAVDMVMTTRSWSRVAIFDLSGKEMALLLGLQSRSSPHRGNQVPPLECHATSF